MKRYIDSIFGIYNRRTRLIVRSQHIDIYESVAYVSRKYSVNAVDEFAYGIECVVEIIYILFTGKADGGLNKRLFLPGKSKQKIEIPETWNKTWKEIRKKKYHKMPSLTPFFCNNKQIKR